MADPHSVQPQPQEGRVRQGRWWNQWWPYLAGVASVITVLVRLSDGVKQWLPGPVQVLLPSILVIAAVLVYDNGRAWRLLRHLLVRFAPAAVTLTLAITAWLLYHEVWPHGVQPIAVRFDPTRGGIFNSWNLPPEIRPQLSKRIRAYGSSTPGNELMWVIEADSSRFTFETNPKLQQNDDRASSGAYMTFYDTPCDRKIYHHVAFDCRMTDTAQGCVPDVGIRLGVDGQGRELMTYQLASLNSYLKGNQALDGSWRRFDVYIPDLKQTSIAAVPTYGIDQDTLNKVVFFVNDAIVTKCGRGTIWIKNVILSP